MKNFVKMILPVAAFALASAAGISKGPVLNDPPETGWQRIIGHCLNLVLCNNMSSTICTSGGHQAYGKIGLDCIKILYHTP